MYLRIFQAKLAACILQAHFWNKMKKNKKYR